MRHPSNLTRSTTTHQKQQQQQQQPQIFRFRSWLTAIVAAFGTVASQLVPQLLYRSD
jgi:hypothetical protein